MKNTHKVVDTGSVREMKPWQRRCSILQTHFEEFCAKSSLHGLQYIGDKQTHWAERCVWILAWFLSMSLGGYLIGQVYHKWNTSPVIVSLAPGETTLWQIPFPAVTVCNNIKARASLFNYTDVLDKYNQNLTVTEEEEYYMERISLAYHTQYGYGIDNTHYRGNNTTDASAVQTMMKLGPGYGMFGISKWTHYYRRSKKFFKPVLTEEGICYSFNSLDTAELYTDEVRIEPGFVISNADSSNWTMSSLYPKSAGMWTYPKRAMLSGRKFGLTFYLKSRAEEVPSKQIPGFKIMLHNPGELADAAKQYLDVPVNTVLTLAVSPNMITTNDNLKNYAPERRKCFFPDQRKLRFYREYSQDKCNFECLTLFTLKTCGCVAFHMPRSEDMAICGPGITACVDEARIKLMEQILVDNDKEDIDESRVVLSTCQCLPSCFDLTYDVETSGSGGTVDMDFIKTNDLFYVSDTTSVSKVVIYFKADQFIASQRSELVGIIEFIAYSGGLLGLFLGFSMLSLCEIGYFATLRLCRARFRTKQAANLPANLPALHPTLSPPPKQISIKREVVIAGVVCEGVRDNGWL